MDQVKLNLDKALSNKESGNEALKNGDYKGAIRHYHQGLLFTRALDKGLNSSLPSNMMSKNAQEESSLLEEVSVDVSLLENQLKLNLCHCLLYTLEAKTSNETLIVKDTEEIERTCAKVVRYCNEILTSDKLDDTLRGKALFRKTKALLKQGKVDDACEQVNELVKLQPQDKPTRVLQTETLKLKSEQTKREKETFKKMF
jgi:DNA-binding SARP family transcriptional activator